MPKTQRDILKRDLDAAVGNLEWCMEKIAKVGLANLESLKYYQDNNLETPELVNAILEGCQLATETAEQLTTIIKAIRGIL